MNIYVDDMRAKPDRYDLLFVTCEEFLEWVSFNKENEIDLLSLDHDFGDGFITGSELCENLTQINDLKLKRVQFHSSNYQGLKSMYSIMNKAKEEGTIPQLEDIYQYKVDTETGVELYPRFFDLEFNSK